MYLVIVLLLMPMQGRGRRTGLRHWLQLRKVLVVVATVLVIVWSAIKLISNTSLFNLLFLFYPLVTTSNLSLHPSLPLPLVTTSNL